MGVTDLFLQKKKCNIQKAWYCNHTHTRYFSVCFATCAVLSCLYCVPDKRPEMLLTRPAHVGNRDGRPFRDVEARELREDGAVGAHGDVSALIGGLAVDDKQHVTAFAAVEHLAQVVGQVGAVVQRVCEISVTRI